MFSELASERYNKACESDAAIRAALHALGWRPVYGVYDMKLVRDPHEIVFEFDDSFVLRRTLVRIETLHGDISGEYADVMIPLARRIG